MYCCRTWTITTRYGRTYLWKRMRRSRAPSNWPGPFFAARSWAGCTTNMFGFDLRQCRRAIDAADLRHRAHSSQHVDGKKSVAQEDQESVAGADGQCVVACEGEGGFVIARLAHQPLTGGLAEGQPEADARNRAHQRLLEAFH